MNDLIGLLPYAAPVAFAALGETIGQRSGVINIGLEGTLLIAAYGALVGATATTGVAAFALGFALAILLAILVTLLSSFFTVWLGTDQVVVGTAINLFALGVTGTLVRARYGQSGQLLSLSILPRWHGLDVVLALLLIAVPGVWYLLMRTRWGLAVRASGEYPKAVEAAGYSPIRLRFQAALIAALFSGVAGGYLVLGTSGTFTENMTGGRGFVAIALVTFGRWRPTWVFAAALLMGYLEALQFKLQASGVAVPQEFLLALPYAVALAVLVAFGKGAGGPAALGTAYRRQR